MYDRSDTHIQVIYGPKVRADRIRCEGSIKILINKKRTSDLKTWIRSSLLLYLCCQFNNQLDQGDDAETGVDIYMMTFFILIIAAHPDGA